MDKVWQLLTLFFLGAIFFAVLTHASGFSQAAGTLTGGVNTLGRTLEGRLCSGEIGRKSKHVRDLPRIIRCRIIAGFPRFRILLG